MKETIENMRKAGDIKGLIKGLIDLFPNSPISEFCEISDALTDIGEKAVEPLLEIFEEEENGDNVERAAEILGKIKDSRAVVPLLEAREKATFSRRKITLALGEIGDNRAVEPLLKSLKKLSKYSKNDGIEVITALGDIGDSRAVKPLTRMLKDKDSKFFSGEAATALGKIFDRRAVKPLIKALKHPNERTQSMAASALGFIGDKRAIRPLLDYLKVIDEKYDRIAAVWALAGITDDKIPELLKKFHGDAALLGSLIHIIESRNPEIVKRAQIAFREKGLYKGKISGRFDYETKKALIAFQKKNGLTITGVLTTTIELIERKEKDEAIPDHKQEKPREAYESSLKEKKMGTQDDKLFTAALLGDADQVRALWEEGANVNAKNDQGWTPLMFAAGEGDTTTADALLSRGADIDLQSENGETALMLAARWGHFRLVRMLLIDAEANVNLRNKDGKTALTIAREKGHTEIVELIESRHT